MLETNDLLIDTLFNNLSDKSFVKIELLLTKHPFIKRVFEKPSSSTNKYHVRKDGSIQTIGEHTYEMLLTTLKLISMFKVELKTKESNTILLSIFLHDILKYGLKCDTKHTLKDHDIRCVEFITTLKNDIFTDDIVYFDKLVDAIKYHSGRWSTTFSKEKNSLNDLSSLTLFTHIIDMLSTKDCLRI